MKTRVPSLLLASFGVVTAYIIILVGNMVPGFFQMAYKAKTAEAKSLMPGLTRFASEYAWVFALAIVVVVVIALACLRRYPSSVVLILTSSLCAQGVVLWGTMFCDCYSGFLGPMCLHHGSEFELAEFIDCGSGIFPISLAALLTPIIALYVHRDERKHDA